MKEITSEGHSTSNTYNQEEMEKVAVKSFDCQSKIIKPKFKIITKYQSKSARLIISRPHKPAINFPFQSSSRSSLIVPSKTAFYSLSPKKEMIKLTKLKFVDLQYVRQRLLLKCSSKPQYNYEQRLLSLSEDPLELTFNHLRGIEESEEDTKPCQP